MENKLFLSGLSKEKNWRKAAELLIADIQKGLEGARCDLVVFFVSESYKDLDPAALSGIFKDKLSCRVILGCNSSGVIGSDSEIEMEPAISILAMHLPGVKLMPFYLAAEEVASLREGSELINSIDIYPTDKPHFMCLADPMSCDVTRFLSAFNEGYKGLPVMGGLASGAGMGAPNWLCLNRNIYPEGMVGLAMAGDIEFDIIVSQGCRPIGQSFVITKAEGNVLYELAGRPALLAVRELLGGLPAKDRALAEQSLFVGLVMNERQTAFKRGDFLIRNLMGFDPETGALRVGAMLKVGQTLQFQLRDAETSSEDLKLLLEKSNKTVNRSPRGGILVSCCGRGRNLFNEPDHDVRLIQASKGPLPLTGFFANGEIGPVGNKNFVHGYTSSLVILR